MGSVSCSISAQNATTTGNATGSGVRALDKMQAEQERLRRLIEDQPKAYQDKVMDPATLPPQPVADVSAPPGPPGFRSWTLETRGAYTQTQASGVSSRSAFNYGVRGDYRRETFNYGDFSLQLDMRSRTASFDPSLGTFGNATHRDGGRLTIRNTGFAITPTSFLNSALGDQVSEVTSAFSRGYRLTLGQSVVRGLGLSLRTADSDWRAGIGSRGLMTGGPYPAFQSAGGTLSWLGYTRRVGEQGFVGLQFDVASNVNALGGTTTPLGDPPKTVKSLGVGFGGGHNFGATPTDGVDLRWRAMLLGSHTNVDISGNKKTARGMFLEAGLRHGSVRHEFGFYTASPELKFGDNVLLSDARGAYWRADSSTSRGSRGLGLDYELVNPSRDPARTAYRRVGVNANVLHRLTRNSSVGGGVSLRLTTYNEADALATPGQNNRSYDGTLYYQTRLGDFAPSRLRLTVRGNQTLVTNGSNATGQELEWEQEWITGSFETMRPELTTTLGWGRDVSTGQTQQRPTAGLVFRNWFSADSFAAGSLRYSSRTGNLSVSRGLSGSVTVETVVDRSAEGAWRVGGAINLNQATITQSATLLGGALTTRNNEKTAQIYLRWDASTGRPFDVSGGRAAGSVGGGALMGTVYYDANRDGEQQIAEGGVAGVELLLDGRQRIVTDKLGQFQLPVVATGEHRLTINLDSVPLPWGLGPGSEKGIKVEVPLRGRVELRIPVVRVE